MKNRIKLYDIIEADLCCGCGTCYSICPTDAISIKLNKNSEFIPKIDNDKCTRCNLCYEVCPNNHFNYKQENKIPTEVYSGYSKNTELRYKAASGGLVSQFLLDGLKFNYFDAVIAVTGDNTNEFKAEILTTTKGILNGTGSKYNQIAVNKILKELNDSKYEKICYVGLPCHIRGLNKYLKIHKKLEKKIVLKFSLVCGQVLTKAAISKQLRLLSFKESEIIKYSFRGNGWPGKQIIASKEKEKQINHTSKLAMGGIFSSPLCAVNACTYCEDHYSVESDISFCDTWHSSEKGKCGGLTSAICWSERGRCFVEKISKEGNVALNFDDFNKLKQAQGHKSTAAISFLLKRKINGKRITFESKIKIKIIDKLLGLSYLFIFKLLNMINLKYYPKSILATTRLLKRLLR